MDSDLTKFFENYRHQRHILTALQDITTRLEAIVAAVDDVNAAVAAIGAQGLTTDEAETIATDLNNLAAQISAALNPPPAQ